MSDFSGYTQSGNRTDLERALTAKGYTQRSIPSPITGAVTATRTIYGPVIRYEGREWDGCYLVVSSVSSPVFTLQPQVIVDGTAYDVGKSVSTSGVSFTAGKPFRCHDEQFLGKKVAAGSVLALKMTRTSGTITDPVAEFVTVGG